MAITRVIENTKAACDSREFCVWLVSSSFETAVGIVRMRGAMTVDEFRESQANLMEYRHWTKNCDANLRLWTRCPVTFGMYHFAGDSALHVASQFSDCVFAASHYAKLQTLGMPDISDLSQDQIAEWSRATKHELESSLDYLKDWSASAMLRDSDLILRRIRAELQSSKLEVLEKSKVRELMNVEDNRTVKKRLAEMNIVFEDVGHTFVMFASDAKRLREWKA